MYFNLFSSFYFQYFHHPHNQFLCHCIVYFIYFVLGSFGDILSSILIVSVYRKLVTRLAYDNIVQSRITFCRRMTFFHFCLRFAYLWLKWPSCYDVNFRVKDLGFDPCMGLQDCVLEKGVPLHPEIHIRIL